MYARNNLSGAAVPPIREYPIAADTNIEFGQVVKLTGGRVVAADAAETGEVLGVAAENHTGAADCLNERNNGLKLKVYDAPDQVFAGSAPVITAAASTETTLVGGADLSTAFADDDFNGGMVMLVEKAEGSTNTDSVGTVRAITDYTASSKTFKVDAGGAAVAGDKYAVFPPTGFAKGNLDAKGKKLVLTASAALSMRVVGCDTGSQAVLMTAKAHALAE